MDGQFVISPLGQRVQANTSLVYFVHHELQTTLCRSVKELIRNNAVLLTATGKALDHDVLNLNCLPKGEAAATMQQWTTRAAIGPFIWLSR